VQCDSKTEHRETESQTKEGGKKGKQEKERNPVERLSML
jgi:hypothetical protein